MTPEQQAFMQALRAACGAAREFVVVSEWLGYLPFGQYIWLEIEGKEVPHFKDIPWDSADIEALARAGEIEVLERRTYGQGGEDSRTRCRLHSG